MKYLKIKNYQLSTNCAQVHRWTYVLISYPVQKGIMYHLKRTSWQITKRLRY